MCIYECCATSLLTIGKIKWNEKSSSKLINRDDDDDSCNSILKLIKVKKEIINILIEI